MTKSNLQRRLEAGDSVTGIFAPAGGSDSFATPGVLTWSSEQGAALELAERSDPWPRDPGELFTVHGEPHEGDVVTLLDARVRRRSSFDQTSHVTSWTLALGALTDMNDRWERANYRPGTLPEWLADTGLTIDRPDSDPTAAVQVTWRRPPRRTVRVAGAELSIYPGAHAPWGYGPRWSIETTMTFGVHPDQPLTIDEHRSQFGNALRGFAVFAADRPDDLCYESYYDPSARRQIVVLQRGRTPIDRDWSPAPGVFVFKADDLHDIGAALAAWFETWERSNPALALFGETIDQGNTYSAPRFLTLYTAAEAYWKKTWQAGSHEPWKLRRLVERAGVSERATGCTPDALALMGEARRYHAHLGEPRRHTVDEVVDQTYASTRRLHALLQACLMRDVGLDVATVERLLYDHYRAWPVP
jgi:hypothetical protein